MAQLVAVTGASGFIGAATVETLEALGHKTIAIDRTTGHDILAADLVELFDGCDAVIHLAGVLGTSELLDSAATAIDVNVRGTLRVLEATAMAGSRYVGITVPDCWPSVYQATKLAATRLADAWHHAHGLPVVHLRTFNVYGPGQAYGDGHPQKIIPTFADCSWHGEPMPIWGDGRQTVDLVHVDHVANSLARAALDGHGHGGTWDIGSGVEWTVRAVASAVGDVTGHRDVAHLPMRVGELPHTRLRAMRPGPFGFDTFDHDRFARTVESYRCTA